MGYMVLNETVNNGFVIGAIIIGIAVWMVVSPEKIISDGVRRVKLTCIQCQKSPRNYPENVMNMASSPLTGCCPGNA
jgi:hypothetical protein